MRIAQCPITNYQSPITNHQLPITNHQSPITVINKLAVISQLERIARNRDGETLTHHEITVIAYGILAVLDDVTGIDSFYLGEIELYLRMLTKRSPHHARCLQAEQCLKYLRKDGEKKVPGDHQPRSANVPRQLLTTNPDQEPYPDDIPF